MKKIFLDSSVFFSAINSPTGGSAKIFTLTNYQLLVSKLILTEVERNVRKKLLDYHLERFFYLVKKLIIIDLPVDKKLIKKTKEIIVKKDVYVLAQAKQSKADIMLTLDKKYFLKEKVRNFLKPTKVFTPKEFFDKIEMMPL